MTEFHATFAILLCLGGLFMLRLAWRLHRGDYDDRRYPTRQHAVLGRAPDRNGRTGWLVYNRRANRLEAAAAYPMRTVVMTSSVKPNGATDAENR